MPSRPARNGLECLPLVALPIKVRRRTQRQREESRVLPAVMLDRPQRRSCASKYKPSGSGMLWTQNGFTVAALAPVQNAACLPMPNWGGSWVAGWNPPRSLLAISVQTQWWVNSFAIRNLYHTLNENSKRYVHDSSRNSYSNGASRLPVAQTAPLAPSAGGIHRTLHLQTRSRGMHVIMPTGMTRTHQNVYLVGQGLQVSGPCSFYLPEASVVVTPRETASDSRPLGERTVLD